MHTIIARFEQIFSLDQLADRVARWLPGFILAAVVFVVFYLLYRLLNTLILKLLRRVELDRTVAGFLLIILKYVLLVFGLMVALQQMGVNVTSLAAGIGIIGVSIGLAAKDTLSNVIAGIFIFWDKPFVIGDLVEVSDEYGEVRAITLRTTRLATSDGIIVSIPNSVIINNKIKCYTMEPNLRIAVDLTVGIEENIDRARELILSTIKDDDRFKSKPSPTVEVTDLTNTLVTLQFRAWVVDVRHHLDAAADVRERAKKLLFVPQPKSEPVS